MDRAAVQDWLDRYVEAWRTYDPALIAALFSPDAEYRYHPWDEGASVVRGRDAIVRSWLDSVPAGSASGRDEPGTYVAEYRPYAVDGALAVAVAVGRSRYWADATRQVEESLYHNAFLLRFDAEGRCSAFTEYFMELPAADAASG